MTIPPEFKECDNNGTKCHSNIYSYRITDDIPDKEKTEKFANILAAEYLINYYTDNSDYNVKVIDYRNVSVTFIAHIDRNDIEYNPEHYSVWNGIGDMEASENAWMIGIDAKVRYDGRSMVGNGCDNWYRLITHKSDCYLLCKDGDTYYLWSRDVYRYERELSQ